MPVVPTPLDSVTVGMLGSHMPAGSVALARSIGDVLVFDAADADGRYRRTLRSLIRWRNRTRWLARLGEFVFGISAKRQLPEPAVTPYAAPDVPSPQSSPASGEEANERYASFNLLTGM